MAPARYTVAAGDTLAGIAALLAVRGGWPALYAANRRVIGTDPNTIRPGIVLTVRRPAASAPGRRARAAAPRAAGVVRAAGTVPRQREQVRRLPAACRGG